MASDFLFPLSGDVTQTLNPFQFWIKSMSQQSGFININNIHSGDPDLERKIVENVAGYGKQLGILMDLMAVMVDKLEEKDLTEPQCRSVEKFKVLDEHIRQAKWDHSKAGLTTTAVDRLMEDVTILKEKDPITYKKLVERIEKGLGKNDKR